MEPAQEDGQVETGGEGQAELARQAAIEQQDLLRRRERLAGEVAELHWDLGGLAYEMAIRDHFRPDVLVRRAAQLQERDAELAEVERKLTSMAMAAAGGEGPTATEQPTAAMAPLSDPRAARRRRFPSLGMWCLLALACLGFGAALGSAASHPPTGRLAAARPPLQLVLPARRVARGHPPALPQESATPAPSEETEPASEGSGSSESSRSQVSGTSGHGSSSSGAAGSGGSEGRSGGGNGGESSGGSGGDGTTKKAKLPPVKHVFLVVLDDEPYATSFGPSSPASYLTHTLERQGELLVRYYAVAHEQLANGIALISGQGPTAQTAVNCPVYSALAPASAGSDGQVLGSGCVYPTSTPTLAGQLEAKHLTWRAYVDGMGEGQGDGSAGCEHPALGAEDASSFDAGATAPAAGSGAAATPPVGVTRTAPSAGASPYATFRNPFVYFQSIAGSAACASHDVGIAKLRSDLAKPARTPSFSYIVPSLCDDGAPTPCAPGVPAGMKAADDFLRRVVPEILASSAYKHGGLLVITVDEAPSGGAYADSSSCCEQPSFPNLPAPTGAAANLSPSGGGEVGALLLSPYVKAGTTSQEAFNHYALLRTIENLFGLGHLGYAALPNVEALGASLFNGRG
jgi:hypothetical protein